MKTLLWLALAVTSAPVFAVPTMKVVLVPQSLNLAALEIWGNIESQFQAGLMLTVIPADREALNSIMMTEKQLQDAAHSQDPVAIKCDAEAFISDKLYLFSIQNCVKN